MNQMVFQDGDQVFRERKDFFEYAVKQFYQEMLMFVVKSVGNKEHGQDITQTVFMKFYKSLNRFEGRSSLRTYLYRIAVNTIINVEEKRKRERKGLLHLFNQHRRRKPQADSGSSELEDLVAQAIGTLPPRQRVMMTLRLQQEFKLREIADYLDTSEGNVKAQVSLGTKKIQEYLKDNGYGM